MKHYILSVFLLPLLVLTACNKSNTDAPVATNTTGINNGTVTTAAGAYAIVGSVNIYSSCASTVATVTVSNYTGQYASTGAAVGSAQLSTGGTFNFPVAPGTYVISATAGSCTVSAAGQALTNGQVPYTICMSTGAECPRSSYYKIIDKASAGTVDIARTGTGELSFDIANIYLSTKKSTNFNLNLQLTSGNILLNSVPSAAQGWNGSVAVDGTLKLGDITTDHLNYSAQVNASLLQFDQGFCDLKTAAGAKAADFLKQSGFSNQSVTGFQAAFSQSNTAEKICVYPQSSVDNVVAYKTDSNLISNRVWFVVVADNSQAVVKKELPGMLAKLISRPKSDGFLGLKKSPKKRQIASDNDILAEEWALGFVLEK